MEVFGSKLDNVSTEDRFTGEREKYTTRLSGIFSVTQPFEAEALLNTGFTQMNGVVL
jgi:hypothetical protein